MKTSVKLAAGALATLGAVALPASASATGAGTPIARSPFAVTVSSPLAKCYVAGLPITVALTGGTPGDTYDADLLQGKNNIDSAIPTDDAPFDSNGDGSITFTDVVPDFSTEGAISGVPISMTVDDYPADGGATITTPVATFEMTQIGFSLAKSVQKPSAPRAFAFSGAFGDAVDYAFVTNAAGTKTFQKFRIGRSNACGYIKAKGPLGPASGTPGTYKLWIYPGPKLVERDAAKVEYKLYRPL